MNRYDRDIVNEPVQDKTIVVTGANSGIGRATATALAGLGAHVVMVSRMEKRGRRARDDIHKRTGNPRVDLLVADLSTRDAIRRLAAEIESRYDRLDVLINNAGLLTRRRRTTPEGFELQFFVNHLAYFMLTNLLARLLTASAPARIVNVASTSHSSGIIDFDDLQFERGYKGWQAYANTKLMNVVFTYELARRLRDTGVTANCLHPGVIHTGLLRNFSSVLNIAFHALQVFFKKPEQGAETPVYLATSREVDGVTGGYFRYCRPMDTTELSRDRDVQRRLWEVSEELCACRDAIPYRD